jgi:PAT family beta-lactamase induction signal transducer AmpG
MASDENSAPRLTTLQSLALVVKSRRTAAVTLQMFFSGMPLGLVWIAIPAWMAKVGIDIRTIGLVTLAQAPWSFKFLWAPLMDRYSPPLLGRKRGWIILAQIALFALMIGFTGVAGDPGGPVIFGGISLEWIWILGALLVAVAFASTVQDIAVDAYAIDVLKKEEYGVTVGARTALYRVGMMLSGAALITIAAEISWSWTFVGLAVLYLLGTLVTAWSPEPENQLPAPTNLREAVWEPLVELLARNRALEIAAFVILYKFSDNVAQALLRPFLVQQGYNDVDVGIASGTIGMLGTIGGAMVGGIITNRIGLGHSLWIFGFLQAISNVGYIWIASVPATSWIMYVSMGFETLTQGLGTGAFFVLLMRLTKKQFSATQYALLSSIFALGRVATGPIAGFLVDAVGWRPFFFFTIIGAAPGMIFLHRFVPFGSAEPKIAPEIGRKDAPVSRSGLVARGLMGGGVSLVAAALIQATLSALKAYRKVPEDGFPLGEMLTALTTPASVGAWFMTIGIVVFAVIMGLATAALVAARRGVGGER